MLTVAGNTVLVGPVICVWKSYVSGDSIKVSKRWSGVRR